MGLKLTLADCLILRHKSCGGAGDFRLAEPAALLNTVRAEIDGREWRK